jgi:uncharacterized membrane protein
MATEKITLAVWLKKNRLKIALFGFLFLIAVPLFYYLVIYIPNQEIREKGRQETNVTKGIILLLFQYGDSPEPNTASARH